MALKAKQPENIQKRLKFFMFGETGVGKSWAAIQFRKAYLIDCERGMEEDQYVDAIKAAGSVLFATSDLGDIIAEVRELRRSEHEYRTIVIDPISVPYHDLVDEMEPKVGTEYGAHYTAANKQLSLLFKLLMLLDMNVIMTAHAKFEYGTDMKRIGITFDAWQKLAYRFDLVLFLERRDGKRIATVRKTRIAGFPDGDSFEWSYSEFVKRHGKNIEAISTPTVVATPEQVKQLEELLKNVVVEDKTVISWLKKASVDSFKDMSKLQIAACIAWTEKKAKGQKK